MRENSPTVSVIIPTYNRAHLIGRAIQSVLNQTYQDFEIIVVDDGSTDNTKEIVKSLDDKRIRYIRHKENKGGGAARNTGIKAAIGEYIAFLDSDDEWLPEKLECQMKVFKNAGSEVGVVYTGFIYIDELGEYTNGQHIPEKRGWIYEDILVENCVGTASTVLVKRKCFEKAGLFDENLPSCQDWEMWIRLAREHQFDFIEDPLVKYHIHKSRISTDLEAKIKGITIVIDKFSGEFTSRRKIYSQRRFSIGNLYCHLGNMKRGRKEFLKAIQIYPFNLKYFVYLISALFTSDICMKLTRIKRRSLVLFQSLRNSKKRRYDKCS